MPGEGALAALRLPAATSRVVEPDTEIVGECANGPDAIAAMFCVAMYSRNRAGEGGRWNPT